MEAQETGEDFISEKMMTSYRCRLRIKCYSKGMPGTYSKKGHKYAHYFPVHFYVIYKYLSLNTMQNNFKQVFIWHNFDLEALRYGVPRIGSQALTQFRYLVFQLGRIETASRN